MFAIQKIARRTPQLLKLTENQRRTFLVTPPRVRVSFLVSASFIERNYIIKWSFEFNFMVHYFELDSSFAVKMCGFMYNVNYVQPEFNLILLRKKG
ncbi:hypothetical protein WH47_07418 [Habropoda laboriosa]|uniref:Uncharacterized protein n=1 Tax=Habropoda laboriosa TaxID=597456 RepID=A0A0L7R6B0_9HYME|nr:hypothetical protein WH47_07418 [Habropoda laboriosa]